MLGIELHKRIYLVNNNRENRKLFLNKKIVQESIRIETHRLSKHVKRVIRYF